jgi:serine protease
VQFAHLSEPKTLAAGPDPLRSQQWALAAIQLEPLPLDVPAAPADDVVIAVLDTGVDRQHPDLAAARIDELVFNGRSRRDHDGHGTHVVGTIAAVVHNGEGIAGICQPQRLISMKVLDPFVEFGYYRALREAIRQRVDVLNLSLSGSASKTEEALVRAALRRGIVVVAAMGNDAARRRCFPAAYRDVIAVGASTQADQHWPASNWGRHITLVAPGHSVLSTVPRYKARRAHTTLYDMEGWHGTSLAAAMVSGTAALCRAAAPDADPRAIRRALQAGADPINRQTGFTYRTGWGRLNVPRTLAALIARSNHRRESEADLAHRRLRPKPKEVAPQNTQSSDAEDAK